MTVFMRKNHYETLGVDKNARQAEIEAAYERACRLFSDGSDAAYSLYTDDERKERLAALEAAYSTLSSAEKRREYDMNLGKALQEDGTYEVDLGYIFGGRDGAPGSPAPQVVRRDTYRNVALAKTLAALDRSEAVATEQFKLLCSKLEQSNRKSGHKVVAFTSAIKGEGKSVVSLNTAFMLASSFGKSIVFVECDLRKPSSLLEYIAADGPGLSEVLKGQATLDEAICSVEQTGLHVVYAGAYDQDASDLMSSAGTADVIRGLRQRFDFVVLDCPPVIPLADMSIIEKLVDGLVLIVRAGTTSRQLVKSAMESLDRKKFIGAVLNAAETKLDKYYY